MAKMKLLLLGLLTAVASAAEAALELTPSNMGDILALEQPKLIEFWAPWCGHCKSLAPVYEELAQGFKHATDKVIIAKVNADEYKEVGHRYKIQGFPTLKWFDGDKIEDYKGGRDLDSLSNFITEKTGQKFKSNKAPSKVQMLNDRTFNETVGSDKNVFCAFTAPWCGHCKSLAPTWEQLALTFANEPSVVIAKVDCEDDFSKEVAKAQSIQGYPTVRFFRAGSREAISYDDERSESALVDFVNKEAGTYRTPGGGLNPLAGTIPSLDTVLQGFADAGSTVAAKWDDLVTAAKAEKGKYAEYYGRVAKKVEANAGYVEKEWKRLQGILKKGNLAPEKIDDLTSRSNILQKFKIAGDKDSSKDKSEL